MTILCVFAGMYPVGANGDDGFVRIPAHERVILDGLTGVPVTVTVNGFFIAKTEVTQSEYERVTGKNPSFHKGPDFPVENVSWWEAVDYCNRRSEIEGLEPCYDVKTGECDFSKNGYRLPTDAEWSFADSSRAALNAETVRRYAVLGTSETKSIDALGRQLSESGTEPAGSLEPNDFGLYDMTGNVWEWCTNYADPARDIPIPLHNPRGPSHGIERVIRGGSFMSMVNSWSRGYRSSLKPESRSRFTGFRIVKRSGETARRVYSDEWYRRYNDIPDSLVGKTGSLTPLTIDSSGKTITSPAGWKKKRAEIAQKWEALLGSMPEDRPLPNAETVLTFDGPGYTGTLMYLDVEKDFSEKILVLIPDRPIRKPTPVIITPYYDIDTPAGENLGGRNYMPPSVRSFASLAAREGYIAVAVRWFGESYGEQYAEAVAQLHLRHPGLTGLGKWVWDARRLVDYIGTIPGADTDNIGIIGHSLGGKMALYAAAFDERITCAVSSELGIGFAFSNYDDFWYFGDDLHSFPPGTDQHELLALVAPRPFLLIGGDEYDTDLSWQYINAARNVYDLYGQSRNIGYFNHRTGHTPSPEAVWLAFAWLKRYLPAE